MSIKPIDHQMSALNTVHEAKNQQDQQNKGQNINSMMQDKMQSEVEKNRNRVIHSDATEGSLVDPDQKKKQEQQSSKKKKNNKSEDLPQAKEDDKGIRLDIRI